MGFQMRMRRRVYMLRTAGPRRFVFTTIPVAVALGVMWWLGFSDPSCRWAGMVLQLFGLASVVTGLNETRREFGMPAVHSTLAQWITHFVRGESKVVEASAGITVGARLTGGMLLTGTLPELPGDATQEQRVARLEKALQTTMNELAQTAVAMDAKASSLESQISAEGNQRASELARLEQRIQAVSTGGIWLSLMGTAWLFVGVVFSSISPELAKWLG